jgi:hypothetical protein
MHSIFSSLLRAILPRSKASKTQLFIRVLISAFDSGRGTSVDVDRDDEDSIAGTDDGLTDAVHSASCIIRKGVERLSSVSSLPSYQSSVIYQAEIDTSTIIEVDPFPIIRNSNRVVTGFVIPVLENAALSGASLSARAQGTLETRAV